MSMKKVIGLSLAGTLLFSNMAFASDRMAEQLIKPINAENIELIEKQQTEIVPKAQYGSFSGSIKEIAVSEQYETTILWLEDENGSPTNFRIFKDTYILDDAKLEVGSTVTGFYNLNAPMTMNYPPTYNPEVVALNKEVRNIKVDRFNQDLVSSDMMLKLDLTGDTQIVLQDGTVFEGELANRKLIVIYGASTRSIPAQTVPEKVVVLFEKPAEPTYKLTKEDMALLSIDVSNLDVVVNNKKVDAIAYTNEQDIVMIPVRVAAEAFGYEVIWDNELNTVTVGQDVSFKIGEDAYKRGDNASISLGAVPEIKDNRTYVPLSFFKKVLAMNNAYVFEAQIVIDNEEEMK